MGTIMDQCALNKTLASFGYNIVIRPDLKHNEILEVVAEVAAQCANVDSLIVCVLSHGFKGIIINVFLFSY